MPNWVFNSFEVKGTPEKISDFRHRVFDYSSEYTETSEGEGFSFHSLITPPADKFEEYKETHGYSKGLGQTGDTEYNWYNWNNKNWQTKWDACNVDYLDDTDTYIHIRFDTAWSPPEPVFRKAVELFPDLEFNFEWEEEQGWGGMSGGSNGIYTLVSEWDIPNSHQDYEDLGKECEVCIGWYANQPEEWYDDCPNKQERIEELNSMKKTTINISGTDVNVGDALEAVIDGSANLGNDYQYLSADMYGVGDDIRKVAADVEIESNPELAQSNLDGLREQFPAVDVDLVK